MLDMHNEDLERSIEINGEQIKKIITMEECGELIQEISKDLRGKFNHCHMVEEIADVLICIEMLKMIYHVDEKELQDFINYKVDRQKLRDMETESLKDR